MSVNADKGGESARPKRLRQVLGPGLIAGASDDDPSGIATYSQAGAQFGYGLLWTLIVTYPLMVAIQEISARLGHVSGRGIAGNLRRHYPPALARSLVALLALANIVNLGADIGAMGAAVRLLCGGPALLYVVLFALVSVLLEVFTTYARYSAILKWLCLSLLSYVLCVFVVDVSWRDVALALVRPQLSAQAEYLTAVVAVFGTTISPYLFFWQAQQEVEEREAHGKSAATATEFRRIRLDTLIGMGLSNIIALCIIITAGATLHLHGLTTIESAAQAAEALRAVAGRFAFAIFALGIVGTGLLTVPVLAASAAYAVGELLSWPVGLNRRPARAPAFYTAVALATLLGCALNFSPINPIRALYWSAVLNGIVAVPVMFAMMHLAHRGATPLPRRLTILGWASTAGMTLAVLGLAVTAIR
jgi:NRAMP (natural resistance-associated macrophage protein)-like metal ion transporter